MFVPQTAILYAPSRFVSMIDALCTVIVTGLAAGMSGPQVIGIWDRLTRILTRFAAILARPIKPRAITRRTAPARQPTAQPQAPARPYQSCRLPTAYGWLIRRLPAATPFAEELQRLICDPQMATLLQANPGMARLLRPLCRMLGVHPPPEVRRPRRPEPSPAAATALVGAKAPPPDRSNPALPRPTEHARRPAPDPTPGPA